MAGRISDLVSAAEVDEQDTHQIIVIGVAAIVPHNAMADSLMDNISLFVEENQEILSLTISRGAHSLPIRLTTALLRHH